MSRREKTHSDVIIDTPQSWEGHWPTCGIYYSWVMQFNDLSNLSIKLQERASSRGMYLSCTAAVLIKPIDLIKHRCCCNAYLCMFLLTYKTCAFWNISSSKSCPITVSNCQIWEKLLNTYVNDSNLARSVHFSCKMFEIPCICVFVLIFLFSILQCLAFFVSLPVR